MIFAYSDLSKLIKVGQKAVTPVSSSLRAHRMRFSVDADFALEKSIPYPPNLSGQILKPTTMNKISYHSLERQ
jgi:hypothetical protein